MLPTLSRRLAALLSTAALGASAAPVTAVYDGRVTGFEPGFLDPGAVTVDDQFPLGTPVRWTLHLDDAFLQMDWQTLVQHRTQTVSGQLQLGNQQYDLVQMDLFSATLSPDFLHVTSYQFQVNGSGPNSQDGAEFFGLWWRFGPQLDNRDPSRIGWAYNQGQATLFGYLTTEGDYRVSHDTVPEPASPALLLAAALTAGGVARRRTAAQKAR